MANMTFGTNILPKTDNTQELGSSTKQWKINASTINGVSVGSNQLATVAQNITGAINELKNNISSLESTVGSFDSPASVFFDFEFSIAVADWTALSGGTYQALVNNNKITANSGIWVFFNDTYQSYAAAPINTTTDNTNHNAVFTTTAIPTGTITGWIRVVDSVNDILPVTRGGTGAGSLADAKSALGITELNSIIVTIVNGFPSITYDSTKINEPYSTYCYLLKSNNIIDVFLDIKLKTDDGNSIITLPTGFRPYRTLWFIISDFTAKTTNLACIDTNGTISISNPIAQHEYIIKTSYIKNV